MAASESEKLYSVQEIPGKGLGIVAIAAIAKGTRLLSETPLIRFPRTTSNKEGLTGSVAKDIAALSVDKRQTFFSLHNAWEDKETSELGIVRTNAIPLGVDAAMGGVFIEASRINHACLQNAQNTWNEHLQQLTIHSIRDIHEKEEITIQYMDSRPNYVDRQRTLQRDFRFTCSCGLCSLPPALRGSSDARLSEIQWLDGEITTQTDLSPLKALENTRKLLRLCDEEGITDPSVSRAYYNVFQIAAMHGDKARAKTFAERACASLVIVEGYDSPMVRRLTELAQDPTKHLCYGHRSEWSTSINDIPLNLSADDFESWLWKRQKTESQVQQRYANLRDESMFPSFRALPDEYGLSHDFYQSDNHFTYYPRKHWCFLAEITDIENFLRLGLIVEDKTGHRAPVFFYTDDRGRTMKPSLLRDGYTVAVLYPEQHGFLDMSVGIRHEQPRQLKKLLVLSDKVQEFAVDFEGEKVCQGCHKKASTLKKCAKCSFFWYCGKECQTLAWKEKGHKADCKLLSDPDLRMLLRLKQNGFDHHQEFSGS